MTGKAATKAKDLKCLDAGSREEWREWLRRHYGSQAGIWLVFHKRRTAGKSMGYEDAVEEALCFGWIDSIIKRLDEDRYARKFTPRKADSKWSTANRRRWADLKTRGLLEAPGLERAPTGRSGDAPRVSLAAIPEYIERELKADARVLRFWEQLAPSCRRSWIGWIDSAKREETKARRLHESVELLMAGKKLGLK